MDLNKRLEDRYKKLDKYFLENQKMYFSYDEVNLVLDIEVSPNEEKTKALTYSVAIMNCDDETDICFKYNTVEQALEQLINLKCKKANVYIHNLYYDIKPFLIEFINKYGNNQNLEKIEEKEIYNPFKKEKSKLKVMDNKNKSNKNEFSYDVVLKKGMMYACTFHAENIIVNEKLGLEQPKQIRFFDTLKIIPYSLQKSSQAFLNLELRKDGIDYDKIRNINDKLTFEEKTYIYDDVFSLKYLVRKLIIEGFEVDGHTVRYTKITNSSQSLSDYKDTLLEDFEHKLNSFEDEEFYQQIHTKLLKTRYFVLDDDKRNLKKDILFKTVFPPLNYFMDSYLRHSYYGGLSFVDFKNVKKYKKVKNKIGVVLDVNSLYPYVMLDKLLPVGYPIYKNKPYTEMNKKYKEIYSLYIQEITIYNMKLKKGKTAFVQVKDRTDFNGREVIEENINKDGKKVPITLLLCNPLLDLLFENYNIKAYYLGGHIAFQGQYNLFKNYLDFWGMIKKKSVGANREIAKLRQNALYGKFGSNGDNEITYISVDGGKFKAINTHEEYITDNIYLPISTFITSYAKEHLIKAINNNRERFMYCDTDSMHLFGTIEEVKGITIHDKTYGAWKHELTFDDFIYIGAKRYAEKDVKSGKWDIKCCGLSDKIMKSIDDISTFESCEYTSKELKKVKLYTRKDDVYYYKDKDFKIKVKGLYKSKKSKIVEGGTLIIEQPYMLNASNFYY